MTEPVLNVGILVESEISFELSGAYTCSTDGSRLSGRFRARPRDGGIVLEGQGAHIEGREEILLQPAIGGEAACFVISGVTIGVKFHWERKEDQRFRGALKLVGTGDLIAGINVVPIEQYLMSVISSEMSAGSSLELLKAHAITSRSWLLAQLEKSRKIKAEGKRYQTAFEDENERTRWYDREDHDLFDVCADDHCQRYQGITKAYTSAVEQAVNATRGKVVLFDGQICDARFSKSCGGVSEAFENVWEPVHYGYLSPVPDFASPPEGYSLDLKDEKNAERWIRSAPPAFCNTDDRAILSQVLVKFDQETTDFYRWRVEYAQEEISDIVRKKSGIDFGSIADLIPVERGASGRLIKLRIVGTKRSLTIGKELEIRRSLSPSHLYSSAFVVGKLEVQGNLPGRFVLTGAGWGHGVGLCQIGAAVMGERGYLFDEILRHYFTGAEIREIY